MMRRLAILAAPWLFLSWCVLAQSVLPGFPPGAFNSRQAVGGGAATCTFPTLSGSFGRWRADVGVTTSGGNVTAVTDQGGGGFTLTNTGNVPFNATGYNGKPAFDFLAANQAGLSNSSFTILGTGTTGSAFFVGQLKTGTSLFGGAVVFYGSSGLNSDFNVPDSAAWVTRDSTNNGINTFRSNASIASSSISLSTNYRIGAIFDGANLTQYVNNSAQGSGASSLSWGNSNSLLGVGNRVAAAVFAGVAGAAWEGPMSEIVVGSAAFDGAERNNLDMYFTCQWGA